MDSRRLGRTGLQVGVISYGGGVLGNAFGTVSEDQVLATLDAVTAAGINLVDTSPFYGQGLSELRVGQLLRRRSRDDLILCTKVGRVVDPMYRPSDAVDPARLPFPHGLRHRVRFDYSGDGVLRSVEQSLLRLGTDRVDILLIHDVDARTHGPDAIEARFAEAMGGAYPALHRLRDEGTVKAIGVGLNEADMCARFARAGDFDAMLVAGRYSLLEQPALQEFLPLAQHKGIGVMLGGVLNSGILATGAVAGALYDYQPAPPAVLERVARIDEVCRSHGVALVQAALQLPLAHPAVSTLVLGATSPEEINQNVANLNVNIPASLWSDLVTEGLLDRDVPVPTS